MTLDEETYPAHKGTYLAVTKLVVDWNAGTASADPTFDQFTCGKVVSDFTSTDVLTGLQTNASTGIKWVAGVKHPTFDWDIYNIPADYAAVDAALTKVNGLNKSEYKNFSAVEDAVKAVDRTKSKAEQAEVDAMAKAIEDAIAALEKETSVFRRLLCSGAEAGDHNRRGRQDRSYGPWQYLGDHTGRGHAD